MVKTPEGSIHKRLALEKYLHENLSAVERIEQINCIKELPKRTKELYNLDSESLLNAAKPK